MRGLIVAAATKMPIVLLELWPFRSGLSSCSWTPNTTHTNTSNGRRREMGSGPSLLKMHSFSSENCILGMDISNPVTIDTPYRLGRNKVTLGHKHMTLECKTSIRWSCGWFTLLSILRHYMWCFAQTISWWSVKRTNRVVQNRMVLSTLHVSCSMFCLIWGQLFCQNCTILQRIHWYPGQWFLYPAEVSQIWESFCKAQMDL